MEFKNSDSLKELLSILKPFNSGSEGTIYYFQRIKKVLKISNNFFYLNGPGIDEKAYDLSKFDNIENDTYILPHEIITIKNKPIGVLYPYIEGNNLCDLNSTDINLKEFEYTLKKSLSDTIKISKDGIKIFDLPYNIMLSKSDIKVIDTESYTKPQINPDEIMTTNINLFNKSIEFFLNNEIYSYFIKKNPILYKAFINNEISIVDLLKKYRDFVCVCENKDIVCLSDAHKLIKKLK